MHRYRIFVLILLFGILPMAVVLVLAFTVVLPALNEPEPTVQVVEVRPEEPPPPPEPIKMQVALAAARWLAAGTLLSAGDVMVREVDGTELPEPRDRYVYVGEVERLADASPRRNALLGYAVRRDLSAGEPVSWATVVGPDDAQFLSTVLAGDRVAVSIPVSLATRQARIVSPGNRVDVLLAVEQNGDLVVRTIVEDVRVIAVNSRLIAEEDVRLVARTPAGGTEDLPAEARPSEVRPEVVTVTLEVQSVQAEYLALGAYEGQLSLAIRPLADAPLRHGEALQDLRSVLQLPAPEPEPEPPPEAVTRPPQAVSVRVVRGSSEATVTFSGESDAASSEELRADGGLAPEVDSAEDADAHGDESR